MAIFKVSPDQQFLLLKEGSANAREITVIKNWLNPFLKNYKNMPKFKLGVWDGKVSFWNGGIIRIGLMKEIEKCCYKNSIRFEIENPEHLPVLQHSYNDIEDFCKEYFKDHKKKDGTPFMPYQHQMEAVWNLCNNRYSTIEVGTGGGKSLIYSIFVFYQLKKVNPNMKFLLIVPSTSLVHQFYDNMYEYAKGLIMNVKTRWN